MLSQQSPTKTGFSKPVKAYANRYKLQFNAVDPPSSPTDTSSSPITSSSASSAVDSPIKYESIYFSVLIRFIGKFQEK